MKRKSAKIFIWSIFLILLKLLPRFDLVIEQSYWVLSAAFIVSAMILLAIPKRVVGEAIALVITVATSFYQFNYFYMHCLYLRLFMPIRSFAYFRVRLL